MGNISITHLQLTCYVMHSQFYLKSEILSPENRHVRPRPLHSPLPQCLKNSSRFPSRICDQMHSQENREQTFFMDESWCNLSCLFLGTSLSVVCFSIPLNPSERVVWMLKERDPSSVERVMCTSRTGIVVNIIHCSSCKQATLV